MANVKGFWSYVREDNELEKDRITDLREQICDEYKIKTGEALDLFQDTKDILWGENWRQRLNEELAKTLFFIPIITPQYFDSEECRKELRRFSTEVEKKGLEQLILPILYIKVPELCKDKDDIDDELVKKIKTRQYEDWTELRLEDQNSPPHRKGVSRLADRLITIVDEVSEISATTEKETAKETLELSEEELEKPGYLDRLAKFQDSMGDWLETIQSITSDIELLGKIGNKYGSKFNRLNQRNAPMSARLIQVKKLSSELDQPSQDILDKGQKYAAQLMDVDPSINAMFEMIEAFPQESYEDLKEFFEGIDVIYQSSEKGVEELHNLLDSLQPIRDISRDMRKPIHKIERGLHNITDAQSVIEDWHDRKEKYLEENEIEFE